MQTLESWQKFIDTDDILFGSNSSEVYFEEDNFDKFAEKLKNCEVEYVHPVREHSWGQRVVRIYVSDITALLVTGSILSVFSGAGMLMV